MKLAFYLLINLMLSSLCYSMQDTNRVANKDIYLQKKRLNFFVSSKFPKADPATISTQLQMIANGIICKKSFYYFFVESAEEMAERIVKVLKTENALIGNIWFDSHGHISKRRSLFEIGKDELNYISLKNDVCTQPFKRLAIYCDTFTKAGIGSCYGGATFVLPAIGNIPESRMNGDSLMIRLSSLLNQCSVFGSESFVMSRIGMFSSRYKLAGRPLSRKFKDTLFKPVWEKLGAWNIYDGRTKKFSQAGTVSISPTGNIFTKQKEFLSLKRNKRKQTKIIAKLKSGYYDLGLILREQNN